MSLKDIWKKAVKKPTCIFVYPSRYISIPITSFLLKTKITPNQVTIISFIFAILSAVSFLLGKYPFIILGAIFLQTSYILDLIDGEIARYKNLKSTFGAWLDTTLDSIGLFMICTAIAIGYFIQNNDILTLILGLLSLLIMASIGVIESSSETFELIKPKNLKIKQKIIEKSKSIRLSKDFYVGIYAPMITLFTLGPLLNLVNLMFVLYLIIGVIALIKTSITKTKLIRDIT